MGYADGMEGAESLNLRGRRGAGQYIGRIRWRWVNICRSIVSVGGGRWEVGCGDVG